MIMTQVMMNRILPTQKTRQRIWGISSHIYGVKVSDAFPRIGTTVGTEGVNWADMEGITSSIRPFGGRVCRGAPMRVRIIDDRASSLVDSAPPGSRTLFLQTRHLLP